MGNPFFTGTHASYTIDRTPNLPFAGVGISDPGVTNASESLTINVQGQGGTLSDGPNYTGPKTLQLANRSDGTYYYLEGPLAQVSQELDALVFTPNAGQVGATTSTGLYLYDISSSGSISGRTPDPSTVVFNTDTANELSFSPQVQYASGVFTLTGHAGASIGSIEITADVDGVQTDLGAAALNTDGSFTFSDRVGPHTHDFITATATLDGSATPLTSTASLSLTGGLRQGAVRAEQDGYTADGSTVAFVSHFQADGQHTTDVLTPGQTLSADYTETFNANHQGTTTFVYNPGHGSTDVTEFLLRSAQHDMLSFSSADFNNSIASVLAHSYGPGDGTGVIIVDPVTQDTVQLAGISKRGLIENRGDISFHG